VWAVRLLYDTDPCVSGAYVVDFGVQDEADWSRGGRACEGHVGPDGRGHHLFTIRFSRGFGLLGSYISGRILR
jgi:hypothetical protein